MSAPNMGAVRFGGEMTQITLQEFCRRMICSRPSRGEVCGFPRQRLMWVTRDCPERKKDYTARISLRIFFKKYIIADNTIFMPEIQFIVKNRDGPKAGIKAKASICIFKEPESKRFRPDLPGGGIGAELLTRSWNRNQNHKKLPGPELKSTLAHFARN